MLKDREVTRRHLERRKHGSEQEMIGKWGLCVCAGHTFAPSFILLVLLQQTQFRSASATRWHSHLNLRSSLSALPEGSVLAIGAGQAEMQERAVKQRWKTEVNDYPLLLSLTLGSYGYFPEFPNKAEIQLSIEVPVWGTFIGCLSFFLGYFQPIYQCSEGVTFKTDVFESPEERLMC